MLASAVARSLLSNSGDSSLVHLIISELVHIGSWSAFLSFENYAHFRSHSFERVALKFDPALPIRSGLSSKTLPRFGRYTEVLLSVSYEHLSLYLII